MNGYLDRFNLSGRVALVTGASEGIGRDLSLGLASAGADMILASRREQQLNEVKAEIEKIGRRAEVFVLDVCRVDNIQALKDFVLDRFDRLDVLVNNAGYTVTKPAWDITEEDWDKTVDTSFKGLFFCCRILGAVMRDQGYGKIINLSSTFSRSTVLMRSIYAGVKAGVSHLTEALAVEWAPHGIRVNALAPTAVNTPSRAETLTGDILKMVLSRIPLGRLAEPDDLITAAIYLASPASDFVTGQTLFVDGGWVAKG
ncbi:MAG: SDR family oxidoreductase [Pseudomonadota bacterium]